MKYNKKKSILFIILLSCNNNWAMELRTPISINEFPEYYTKITQKLIFEPSCILNNSRFLFLKDWNDCKICELLSLNSCKGYGIVSFNEDVWALAHPQYFAIEAEIPQGIQLQTLKRSPQEYDLEEIFSNYKIVITKIKKGWKQIPLQNIKLPTYFNIFNDPWIIFVKESSIKGECDLITFMIEKFGLSSYIVSFHWCENCINQSHRCPFASICYKSYLCVNKYIFSTIQEKFNFEFIR